MSIGLMQPTRFLCGFSLRPLRLLYFLPQRPLSFRQERKGFGHWFI